MKKILFAVIFLTSFISVKAQDFSFRESYPFDFSSNKGRVELAIKNKILSLDRRYSAEYTFYVTYSSYTVYNWQFDGLLPLPGQLALFNEKKEYLGDLFYNFAGGSRRGASTEDWTLLFQDRHVGAALNFGFGNFLKKISPGKYYIQLILYRAFTQLRFENPNEVYRTFDKNELCRSNLIKIKIVNSK